MKFLIMKDMTRKITVVVLFAFFATLLIFYIMGKLISHDHDLSKIAIANEIIEFSMVRPKSILQEKKRIPKKKEQIKPPSLKPVKSALNPMTKLAGINVSDLMGDFGMDGVGSAGNIQPVIPFSCEYPENAKVRGTEGWVLVEFTITKTGSVRDVYVLEASPPNVFDRSTIRCVSRARFPVQKEDGVPVAVTTKQYMDFVLEKEQ